MPPIDLLPLPYIPYNFRIPVHDVPGDLWRLVDRFDSVYYNGLDIRIYMDKYRIEDAVGLVYDIREQVVPVYGYASYTYDRALRGQRIIEGSFTVIFKKPYALIERVANIAQAKESDRRAVESAGKPASRLEGAASSIIDILEWSDQQRLRYWGPSEVQVEDEELMRRRYPLWYKEELSIRIFYNDPLEAKQREGRLLALEREHVLTERKREETYTLIEQLEGVQIVGVSRAIEDSGRPILESYQFLARDIRVLY